MCGCAESHPGIECQGEGCHCHDIIEDNNDPGFYKYSGGAQTMLFLKDRDGQWWVWLDDAGVQQCAWEYIEQALHTWELVKI